MSVDYSFSDKKNDSPEITQELITRNLNLAFQWFKTHPLVNGMKRKVSPSGGPLGSIPRNCLTLSWQAPFGEKGQSTSRVVMVAQNRNDFMKQLEESYEVVKGEAERYIN